MTLKKYMIIVEAEKANTRGIHIQEILALI